CRPYSLSFCIEIHFWIVQGANDGVIGTDTVGFVIGIVAISAIFFVDYLQNLASQSLNSRKQKSGSLKLFFRDFLARLPVEIFFEIGFLGSHGGLGAHALVTHVGVVSVHEQALLLLLAKEELTPHILGGADEGFRNRMARDHHKSSICH